MENQSGQAPSEPERFPLPHLRPVTEFSRQNPPNSGVMVGFEPVLVNCGKGSFLDPAKTWPQWTMNVTWPRIRPSRVEGVGKKDRQPSQRNAKRGGFTDPGFCYKACRKWLPCLRFGIAPRRTGPNAR